MSRTMIIIAILIFQIKFACSNIYYAKYEVHEIFDSGHSQKYISTRVATDSHILTFFFYVKYMLSSNL